MRWKRYEIKYGTQTQRGKNNNNTLTHSNKNKILNTKM